MTKMRVSPSGKFAEASDYADSPSPGKVFGILPSGEAGWVNGGAPVSAFNVVYVGKGGSDVTGDGSEGNPYLTITKALTSITDAVSGAKQYIVSVGPGDYPESVTLTDGIWVVGYEVESTTISGALVDFHFPVNNSSAGFANIWLVPVAVTFDWDADGADGGTVTLTNVIVDTNLTLNAHDAGGFGNGYATFIDVVLHGDYIQNGCRVEAFNFVQQFPAGPAFHITNQLNQQAVFEGFGGGSDGNLTLEALAAPVATFVNVNLRGFAISAGNYNKIVGAGGTNPTCNAEFGHVPTNPNIQTGGKADNQTRFSHQFTDIAPNPTAIAATAVTVVDVPVPVGQLRNLFQGGNDIEFWHMQAMPVGTNWGSITTHQVGVWFYFVTAAGIPTIRVCFNNAGAGFNITDPIDLNVSGHLPDVL